MLRNIPLGIYYPGTSVVHRLQARTKLLVMVWLVIVLLIANHREWHFAPYGAVILLVVAGMFLAGLSPRDMWRRIWFLFVITIISALLAIFANLSDPKVLYRFGPWPTSYALVDTILLILGAVSILLLCSALVPALRKKRWLARLRSLSVIVLLGILLFFWLTGGLLPGGQLTIGPFIITYGTVWVLTAGVVMLLTLYTFSVLLTMTTLPVAFIEGMTMLLSPLRRLKLPVDDFALMTLLALRFIPTMFDEAEQLIKAQTARGADLTHGTIQQRIQSLFMFFIPLIEGTLRRASDLSVALEARGYRAEGRQTLLHETAFGLADYAVLGTVILVTVGALLL